MYLVDREVLRAAQASFLFQAKTTHHLLLSITRIILFNELFVVYKYTVPLLNSLSNG